MIQSLALSDFLNIRLIEVLWNCFPGSRVIIYRGFILTYCLVQTNYRLVLIEVHLTRVSVGATDGIPSAVEMTRQAQQVKKHVLTTEKLSYLVRYCLSCSNQSPPLNILETRRFQFFSN